jgi:hypothetical protein
LGRISAHFAVLVVTALIGAGAAGGARAWTGPAADSYVAGGASAFQSNASAPASQLRTLEWNARKGRWGLKLDVEQHTDGARRWDDVQPGVFFRVTPRLHIGGGVSLAPDQIQQANPAAAAGEAPAPRVRLESTFKF